jgi:hypothetical protein
MKNLILLTAAIIITTFSFAAPGEEESAYENQFVSYSVEKITGKVLINVDIKNLDQYSEVRIVRSDNPVTNFRQIKLLSNENLSQLSVNNIVIDKYPLPSKSESYYKLVTIDAYGVQKSYPSVKLN